MKSPCWKVRMCSREKSEQKEDGRSGSPGVEEVVVAVVAAAVVVVAFVVASWYCGCGVDGGLSSQWPWRSPRPRQPRLLSLSLPRSSRPWWKFG